MLTLETSAFESLYGGQFASVDKTKFSCITLFKLLFGQLLIRTGFFIRELQILTILEVRVVFSTLEAVILYSENLGTFTTNSKFSR